MYSDELTNHFWLKKVSLPVFLLNNFFVTNLLLILWNY